MDEARVEVLIERMAGSVSRVEAKLDTALADLQRRMGQSEEDRSGLHARVNTVAARVGKAETKIESLEKRTSSIENRVGGAFNRNMPIVISGLALLVTVIMFAVGL